MQNPSRFIMRHGLRYIHSITYGGSFLGSVTLNSKQTVDERDIEAFAKFSVNKGLFSASGSTEFQNTMSQQNLNVSVFINAQWVGGSGIRQDYQNPETLNNMFQDWDNSWRSSPAPLTVVTRRWIDSAEVQGIINSMPAEDQALFQSPDVSAAIRREISKENAMVTLVDTSVKKALTWREIRDYPACKGCLENLERDVTRKLILIDQLDDATLWVIQEQWLAGNYSWFKAASLQDRYLQCVDGVEAPTPAPQPVDLIVGVNSYSCRWCGPPSGYLAEDTNKGFGGRYVYVGARVEKSLEGIAGFEFRQHSEARYKDNNR